MTIKLINIEQARITSLAASISSIDWAGEGVDITDDADGEGQGEC